MADSGYERVVCVKNEVFVYQIPARTSNRGYRAAEWNLDQPAWTGRMRCVASEKILQIKLEDRNSGELFAMCPVDTYPSNAVEQVLDSSRYFVIQIADTTGRHAFIGIGFADRADSFDLLVTMQDHFKWLKREEKEKHEATQPEDTGPKLDLSFKEGQTIKINLAGSTGETRKSRPRNNNAGGGLGLLPPPPGGGGMKLPAPPRGAGVVIAPPSAPQSPAPQPAAPQSAAPQSAAPIRDLDFLLGSSDDQAPAAVQPAAKTADPWGDFASAGSTNTSAQAPPPSGNWVQF